MFLPLAFALPHFIGQTGMIALMLFGFGFVIFWHELGHFLAAKAVGIRVEQFAVGFGNALFAWRKGIGFRFGNTQKDYKDKATALLESREKSDLQLKEKIGFTDAQIDAAATELGLGDTEYRLNWIPLGGYVKMLGQDDLKPDAVAEDPRAYNKKSISARMLVISAGVIMNVILAAIGFMVLFLMGFNVPPAWVGNILPNSPAQRATIVSGGLPSDAGLSGIQPGDRIVSVDGHPQEDFTKITLTAALLAESEPVTVVVDRPNTLEASREEPSRQAYPPAIPKDFHRLTLLLTPARREADPSFLAIGFEPPRLLQGPPKLEGVDQDAEVQKLKAMHLQPDEAFALLPGDTITAVNGQPVTPKDFALFNHIVQTSYGKPLKLTIKNAAGVLREEKNSVHFADLFNPPFNIAGIIPRTQIGGFAEASVVRGPGQLEIGDVIVSIKATDTLPHPTHKQLIDCFDKAGTQNKPIDVVVNRVVKGERKDVTIAGLKASLKLPGPKDTTHYGMGIELLSDEKEAVIASLTEDGPAKRAGLQGGDRILSVDGQPVQNWFDVQRLISQATPKQTEAGLPITYKREDVAEVKTATLQFAPDQLASVRGLRYAAEIQMMQSMADYIFPRKALNANGHLDPLLAAHMGVTETRDFILQFYVTLRRMFSGSVSASNMMGPLGIAVGGAKFAFKGYDWLLWFLCMISANLAVVNFLPIPVVDGGQFVFLIMEKIKGKPLSIRAMEIAQYVGLAFLAGLVLFVTYHDILRMVKLG